MKHSAVKLLSLLIIVLSISDKMSAQENYGVVNFDQIDHLIIGLIEEEETFLEIESSLDSILNLSVDFLNKQDQYLRKQYEGGCLSKEAFEQYYKYLIHLRKEVDDQDSLIVATKEKIRSNLYEVGIKQIMFLMEKEGKNLGLEYVINKSAILNQDYEVKDYTKIISLNLQGYIPELKKAINESAINNKNVSGKIKSVNMKYSEYLK